MRPEFTLSRSSYERHIDAKTLRPYKRRARKVMRVSLHCRPEWAGRCGRPRAYNLCIGLRICVRKALLRRRQKTTFRTVRFVIETDKRMTYWQIRKVRDQDSNAAQDIVTGVRYLSILWNQYSIIWMEIRSGEADSRVSGGLHAAC
ncbi:hypothetical protein EVAR_103554_1 [Eumeta japonica]|uniref:Uncharacterized protein n=1 Tax=Eumeta variegata TaxID=151549 RepID=A0A4C1YI39_EUMVA|nr:hypothetical protein EVAR_103554_1 [Eumeta japonica]